MSGKNITINTGDVSLEARITKNDANKGAIITHPHPFYSGTLLSNVVKCALDTLTSFSYTAIRFNFRGVGKSTGEYSGGTLEIQDVLGVFNYLKTVCDDNFKTSLAGYSFGAQVLYHASKNIAKQSKIFLISPPIDVMDFLIHENRHAHNYHIILANNDEFCSVNKAKDFAKKTGASLDIISECNHFYLNKEEKLSETISKWLK